MALKWISRELQAWLTSSNTTNEEYEHALVEEDVDSREAGLASLTTLVYAAHADARGRLERLTGISLDPLGSEQPPGWQHYPDALHTTVLQGYLGEVLAGLIAENYRPHGK